MEDMLIAMFFGFCIGWWAHTRSITKRVLRDPDAMINILKQYKATQNHVEELREQIEKGSGIAVQIERHDTMYYIFSKDKNEFISQGATVEDALEAARQRFPNQNFHGLIPKEEADAWGLNNKV